ncbi:hypothetical protein SAMN05443270_3455 [Lacrimispora sphenoides]|uniref:hypothetical protein n=1 Tax=Lacrimispora sphenoides TaxID=29370 RepID=UPI0008C8B7DE|nr:hypothetical protein [Lacrimispora sphenoides]SEU22218.1 hypothetical protein SAMN05443270_3455 [Lacrimispora sphenoides]
MVNLDIGASAGSYIDYIKLFMNILTGLFIAGAIFRSVFAGLSCLSNDQPLGEFLKKLKKIILAAILSGSIPQIIRLIAEAYGGA